MRFTICLFQLATIALVNAELSTPLSPKTSPAPLLHKTSSSSAPLIPELSTSQSQSIQASPPKKQQSLTNTDIHNSISSEPTSTPPILRPSSSALGSIHPGHGVHCNRTTSTTPSKKKIGPAPTLRTPKSSSLPPILRPSSSALGSIHPGHGVHCNRTTSTTPSKKNIGPASTPLILRSSSSALGSIHTGHGNHCNRSTSTTPSKKSIGPASTPLILRSSSSALRSNHAGHGAHCKHSTSATASKKSTLTPTPTSTPLTAFHVKCYHSANSDSSTAEHGWCVCDDGITHPAPAGGQCPVSTIPAAWIPKSTPSVTATPTPHHQSEGDNLGYEYTFYDYAAGGARVACETSSLSVERGLGIGHPETATACVGKRQTLTTGIHYYSTASATHASPVSCGNWASDIAEPSPIQDKARTSERDRLASSIYVAFSKACVDTTSTRVMTINTTTWDDNLHHMKTVSAQPTFTACGSDAKFDAIDSSYLMADKVETGTIQVSVIDSYFTKEHINRWMWLTAFAYAYTATSDNNTKFIDYEEKSAYTGNTHKKELAQHFAPQWLSFSYYGSFWGYPLESFATQMHFQLDPSEEASCELLTHMIVAFVGFAQTVGTFGAGAPLAGVEMGALEAGFKAGCEVAEKVEQTVNVG